MQRSSESVAALASALAKAQAELVNPDSATPTDQGPNLLPDRSSWSSFPLTTVKNRSTKTPVGVRQKLGGVTGMLAYGVQAKTYRYKDDSGNLAWREPSYYGLIELTNLGVFAQWFPQSGIVRVEHLSDGLPVKGAHVDIYRSNLDAKSRPQPAPCASGTTDQSGTLALSGSGPARRANVALWSVASRSATVISSTLPHTSIIWLDL